MGVKQLYLDWETFYPRLVAGQYTYFGWELGAEPSWIEGVVIHSTPGSQSVEADASVDKLTDENIRYDELIPEASEGMDYLFTIQSPFNHFRIKPSADGVKVGIYSNGRLEEISA